MTDDEIAGLRLFIGRANCTQCHNGPLLTNNEFHNTGVPPRPELPLDRGRLTGATAVAGVTSSTAAAGGATRASAAPSSSSS